MPFRKTHTLLLAASAAAGFAMFGSVAEAATLHALTEDGRLTRIDATSRRAMAPVMISGAGGRVLSIAVRPADGKLYALTDAGMLVTIDPTSGRATPGAKLDKPVEVGPRAAINFNPTVDRLRVVGINGANYRIHPDTGAVTVDKPLNYAAGTQFSGTTPAVTAAAYTNHMAGAKETMLYTIDTTLSQINTQAPPNDGVQNPKLTVDAKLPKGIGFDIVTDAQGGNMGYVVASSRLWGVVLPELTLKDMGPITGLAANAQVMALAGTQ